MSDERGDDGTVATHHIAEANHAVRMSLPLDDREDFEDARRGFIAALSPALVERHAPGA